MKLTTGPSFGSLDYLNRVESLHTPLLSEDSPGSIARHADVLMLIGAPADFDQIQEEAYLTLFFDNHGQQRKLPENTYQITCPEKMEDTQFSSWAAQASLLLQRPFIRQGAVGLDPADLRAVLSACLSRRLILEIIDYNEDGSLPLDRLKQWHFRNLFACLYGGAGVGLDRYTELGSALEQINPELDELKIGFWTQAKTRINVLILGESI